MFQAPYQDPIQQQQQHQQTNLESEYWEGAIRQFDPRTNCPPVSELVNEQEVTLAKIATLEDDYSKMKRALLSSMDEEEEEGEVEEDVRAEFSNVIASSSKLSHVNSSSSRSSSRSFNPEPPSNRDSRQAAHGKALIVEQSVDLRGNPPELKHERDVLARASNVEGSEIRGRSLEKGRLLLKRNNKNTATTSNNNTNCMHQTIDDLFIPNLHFTYVHYSIQIKHPRDERTV